MRESLDRLYNTQIPTHSRRTVASMMRLQDPWDRRKVAARVRAGDQLPANRSSIAGQEAVAIHADSAELK